MFRFIPNCRSASFRNQRSASLEFPSRFLVAALARQKPSCGDEYKHDCYDHNDNRNLTVLWCLLRLKHDTPPFVLASIIRLTICRFITSRSRTLSTTASPSPNFLYWVMRDGSAEDRAVRGVFLPGIRNVGAGCIAKVDSVQSSSHVLPAIARLPR